MAPAQGGGNNFGIVTNWTLSTHPQIGGVYVSYFLLYQNIIQLTLILVSKLEY